MARRVTTTNKFQSFKCLKFPSELFLYDRRDLRTSTKYFCPLLSMKHENKQTTKVANFVSCNKTANSVSFLLQTRLYILPSA